MPQMYCKLFQSITTSTVWVEPHETLRVWITFLALSDSSGRVFGSIPGIANLARVTLEECKTAVDKFLGPDEFSRTPDFEGRRLMPIDGGWKLINHEKYRSLRNEEIHREQKRLWAEKNRQKKKTKVEKVEPDRTQWNHTDTDTDTNTNTNTKENTAPCGAELFVGIDPEIVRDFRSLRAKKRAEITKTAIQGIEREANKAGISLQDALRICCERAWIGFKAEWIKDVDKNQKRGVCL